MLRKIVDYLWSKDVIDNVGWEGWTPGMEMYVDLLSYPDAKEYSQAIQKLVNDGIIEEKTSPNTLHSYFRIKPELRGKERTNVES